MISPTEHFNQELIRTKLISDVTGNFDLANLDSARLPLRIGEYLPTDMPQLRLNHYMIRGNNDSDYTLNEADHPTFRGFLTTAEKAMAEMNINVSSRYCYLTVDQGKVEPGETLREPGWHIDGMQGDEVPIKQPGDLQFIWSDALPTEFAAQRFNIKGLNPSENNVFKWVGDQVIDECILETDILNIYAMGSYAVHRATNAVEPTYKRFMRLSFTHTPITSTRMTINDATTYNYPVHSTSGEIPNHLS